MVDVLPSGQLSFSSSFARLWTDVSAGFCKDVVYLANEFVTTLEARIVTIIIFIPPCVLSYNVETMEGMRAFEAGENATLFCYIPLVGRRLIQRR